MLKRFDEAIEKIKSLAKQDDYLGAFIFGSVARGDADENSDLDIKIIIKDDNPCENISHPFIGGVKLDITFISQGQLAQMVKQEQNSGRIPMIAESIILFDKNGHLKELKEIILKDQKPLKFSVSDYPQQQFFIYHADEKVQRNLKGDPETAMLAMTVGLNELINIHYRINGKYKISSKRMLKDLDSWDKPFADLLRKFLFENQLEKKFEVWSGIVNHIVKPMGGKLPIENNICDCSICSKAVSTLLED